MGDEPRDSLASLRCFQLLIQKCWQGVPGGNTNDIASEVREGSGLRHAHEKATLVEGVFLLVFAFEGVLFTFDDEQRVCRQFTAARVTNRPFVHSQSGTRFK